MHKITNFQTSFSISGADVGKIYDAVKSVALQWLKGKEKDRRIDENALRFPYRLKPQKNLYNTGASVETDTFKGDDDERWAMRYCHPDREAERFWYVDVGLTKYAEHVVFLISVAYAWRETYLGDQSESPPPNIPWMVKGVLQAVDANGWTCYSGSKEVLISAKKVDIVQAGQGKSLWDLVANPERRIPVIAVNGSRLEAVASTMADSLQGKAVVVHIHDDIDLAEELRYIVPEDMNIRYQQLRVFFPFGSQRRRPQVHRYYYPEDPGFDGHKQDILKTILRNYVLQEDGATNDVIDIGSRIKRHLLISKLLEKSSVKAVSNEEVTKVLDELASDYNAKIAEKQRELEMFEEENRTLEQDLHESRSKLHYLEQTMNGGNEPRGTAVLVRGQERDLWPGEVACVVHTCLEKSRASFPSSGRIADIVDDLMQVNAANTDAIDQIIEALNEVFKAGYESLSKKQRQRLESVGLTISDDGKHYKMRLGNDSRYSVTFAKSASDHRSGLNILRDIKGELGLGAIGG